MGEAKDTVSVGSSGKSSLQKLLETPMDKRGFLRGVKNIALGGAAALAMSALPEGVVEAAKTPRVQFKDVASESKLSLYMGGATFGTEQIIHYFGAKSDLQVRLAQDGSMVCKPFSDQATTERKFGEIVDPRISKLKRNAELSSAYTIGMYYTATGNTDSSEREDLDEQNCFGIPVITQNMDYKLNGALPFEHNVLNKKEDFGIGWAVGSMREIDGQRIFNLKGFVLDSRALVPTVA